MKILIVDDDAITRMKLGALLKPYGNTEEAENGQEALKKIKENYQNRNSFSVCTLDIEMPGWSGQETLQRIRAWEEEQEMNMSQRLRIIMITMKKDQQNIMKSFFEGSEWYLKKPVTPENLKKSLSVLGVTQK